MSHESQDSLVGDAASSAGPMIRYSGIASALHWGIAVLVLVTSGLALFREAFSRQAIWMISAHKVVGLCVLALGLLLLLWRLAHPSPPLPRQMDRREVVLAKSVHWFLYALMIIVPLAGWVFTSLASSTRALDYRGLDSVPRLWLAIDDAASSTWHEAHELAGFTLIGLFLVHIAGAYRHQLLGPVILRERMLTRRPRWLRPLIFLCIGLWLAGLSFDLLGLRLT